jgi:DNA-binding HxlR family transcriptional regulator
MGSNSSCRIDAVLDVISDLWTLGIIHELSIGPRRTIELFGSFNGMSSKTLATRLKKLRRHGVVERRSYPEAPPRVEYSLTAKGRELLSVLRAIAEVAARWQVDGRQEDLPPCRACEIVFEETMREEQAKEEPEQPRSIARRRRDVTLL